MTYKSNKIHKLLLIILSVMLASGCIQDNGIKVYDTSKHKGLLVEVNDSTIVINKTIVKMNTPLKNWVDILGNYNRKFGEDGEYEFYWDSLGVAIYTKESKLKKEEHLVKEIFNNTSYADLLPFLGDLLATFMYSGGQGQIRNKTVQKRTIYINSEGLDVVDFAPLRSNFDLRTTPINEKEKRIKDAYEEVSEHIF